MDLGDDYHHLTIETEGRAVWATIDNPPINLITRELLIDLLRFSERAMADPDSTVIVLQSANPDFFIAHFDVTLLQPSVVFGRGDSFFNRFGALLKWAPVLPLACPGSRMQPVWARDVADALSHAVWAQVRRKTTGS